MSNIDEDKDDINREDIELFVKLESIAKSTSASLSGLEISHIGVILAHMTALYLTSYTPRTRQQEMNMLVNLAWDLLPRCERLRQQEETYQ